MDDAAYGEDPREHYPVKVVNLPPTEIVCKCGARFTQGNLLAAIGTHMELNHLPDVEHGPNR